MTDQSVQAACDPPAKPDSRERRPWQKPELRRFNIEDAEGAAGANFDGNTNVS